MRSRKYVILLWAMLLCVVFAAGGCKKSEEENSLVSIEETDILADVTENTDRGSSDKASLDAAKAAKKEDGKSTGDESEKASGENPEDTAEDTDGGGIIYVDVCGQVKNPGVYRLEGGSRIYEAVELAGGMTEDAAEASLNQAEKLTDGQQIYVLSKEEQREARESGLSPAAGEKHAGAGTGGEKTGAGAGSTADGKVNLNTASKEELMTLTGIGAVKADSIIRYREEHGGFQSADDVKKIEGIKDGVFNKIKDQITV